jgi:molybdopterin converting factor subunit 1
MSVTIKLFAVYRDLTGQSELQRDIAEGTTIADLFRQVAGDKADPRLQAATLFALNESYVPADTVVSDGDRVAFIPPVAGG